ncbi:MAG: HAD-IIB family hydrolase [Gammaproteobacteria bacterium]|nr:HAD-IIB family hydrolase [Gammaproteobacteria bacterium]MDH3449894.1 HAD-IIB family hydrolase [Gammaproteobacteria bacterium]
MLERLLICTDLDRTLIPNGSEPESSGARGHFARLAGRTQVTLAYVSGRHRDLIEDAITRYDLPVPDFVLGDVGTTIYHVGPRHDWELQPDWEQEIARDWNGLSGADLEPVLRDLPDLRLQERSRQNIHKLSYYVPIQADRDRLAGQIKYRLDSLNVSARLVWSLDDANQVGLLDLLPARASKYHAIEALMREQRLSCNETVFCGDSGNDIEALASPVPAVLVANSQPEVQALAQRLAAESGNANRLYIAKGDFMGLNGNYSGGMLEGIAHFFPDTVEWMGFTTGESGT